MALVAYDNSDSSEFEDEESKDVTALNEKSNKFQQSQLTPNGLTDSTLENVEQQKLFNLLPQPSYRTSEIIEVDDEFLHKRAQATIVKPKAKISVPSLSEFKDVEDIVPVLKPRISSEKKSGLLSILPEPRNTVTTTTRSLIPHVLAQKPIKSTVKLKKPLSSPMKNDKVESKLAVDYSDDSDSDNEVQNDFFSFKKTEDIPVVEDLPLDIKQEETLVNINKPTNQKEPWDIQSYFKKGNDPEHIQQIEYEYGQSSEVRQEQNQLSSNSASNSSTNNEVVLDDEAILKLCGTRGKRKREDIHIVDVNQQEVLADAREWLLKGLMDDTSKRVSSSKKKGNEPTNQQKRKHQITYLAHQAKANEAELQNQWANNRMSKRQTQSKYGF